MTPALAAAAALHLALFAVIVLGAKPPPMPAMGAVVPITIVANAPVTDSRPAEVAPQVQAAAVENPQPSAARPEPPAPSPKPSPTPAPAKATTQAVPRQTKPAPAARIPVAKPTLNLDALKASIAKAPHAAPRRPAFAQRGSARAETAPQARVDAGQSVSQSDQQGLQGLLERLWNPNCAVEGGSAVTVPVRFRVAEDGRVVGSVTSGGEEASSNPVVFAAARRAIDAVHQAEPYAAPYRGKSFTVNFIAKDYCSKR